MSCDAIFIRHYFHTTEDTQKHYASHKKVRELVDLKRFTLFAVQLFTGHPIITKDYARHWGI